MAMMTKKPKIGVAVVVAKKDKGMSLPVPEGVEIPDGVDVGDDFEALVTMKLMPGNMVRPIKMDGVPMDGQMGDESEDENGEGGGEDGKSDDTDADDETGEADQGEEAGPQEVPDSDNQRSTGMPSTTSEQWANSAVDKLNKLRKGMK